MTCRFLPFFIITLCVGCATAPPPRGEIRPVPFLLNSTNQGAETAEIWTDTYVFIGKIDGNVTPEYGEGTRASLGTISVKIPAGKHSVDLTSYYLRGKPSLEISALPGHSYLIKAVNEGSKYRVIMEDYDQDSHCYASLIEVGYANFHHYSKCEPNDSH